MTDGTAGAQRERELKFDVAEHWVLPDTTRLSASSVSDNVTLTSVYYDTDALDLLANTVTLRQRTGGGDDGWQLKLPDGDARLELAVPVNGRAVPKPWQQVTFGVRRGAPLRPVAQLRTHRATQLLLDSEGVPLAELAVDDVTATRTGEAATVMTWREVEVELKNGDERLLRRAAKLLRKSGASPARATSKLARTMEQPAADVAPAGDTVATAVRAYLAEQHELIMRGDIDLRREQDVIHRTRVATRRYRSVLRVFGDLFDADRKAALDAELKWYAASLGRVRDLQVLGKHVHAQLDQLPGVLILGPVRARLDSALGKDAAAAQRALATAMRSRRYLALLDDLRSWATAPPLVGGDEPVDAVVDYLRRADKQFRHRVKHLDRLDEHDPGKNEASHRARKAAKRDRYIAELAEPVLGKRARAVRKRAKTMQSDLGKRQDAVVAVDFLRRLGARAGTTPGENGFTFGILLMREAQRGGLDLSRA